MGFFGLIYPLFIASCKSVKRIRDYEEDKINKVKFYNSETNTYLNHSCENINAFTGHRMKTEKDYITNEVWLIDLDLNKRVRNLTLERADKVYNELRQKYLNGETDRTHIQYGTYNYCKDKNNYIYKPPYARVDFTYDYEHEDIKGIRYKDLETGKIYVARQMNLVKGFDYLKYLNSSKYKDANYNRDSCYVLMDIETKKPVRFTDRCLELYYMQYTPNQVNEIYEKLIDCFYKSYNDEAFLSHGATNGMNFIYGTDAKYESKQDALHDDFIRCRKRKYRELELKEQAEKRRK